VRPEYIAQVHSAKYDLRFCKAAEKAEYLENYKQALAEAARIAKVSPHDLECALRDDFRAWVRQERLPKPPGPRTDG
jgi:hypothetical protein